MTRYSSTRENTGRGVARSALVAASARGGASPATGGGGGRGAARLPHGANIRSPVPADAAGARPLTSDEAADLWNANGAIFIDVYPQAPKPKNLPAGTFWRDPVHRSIEGAHWLPNVGYGALPDDVEAYFRDSLERLTKGNRAAPIVFFCLRDCWMSWNAAKRAVAAGYSNVMWFRDGTDGWQELGYPLVDSPRFPEAGSATGLATGSWSQLRKPRRCRVARSLPLSSAFAARISWRCRRRAAR